MVTVGYELYSLFLIWSASCLKRSVSDLLAGERVTVATIYTRRVYRDATESHLGEAYPLCMI